MSLVGYARVSTTEGRQVLDRQRDALNAAGCERVFEDHASGATADRPNLTACLDYLRAGDVLTGNFLALHRFRFEVERLWRKWLGRRSWRGRMTWERFARLRNTYPLPAARVVHSVYR